VVVLKNYASAFIERWNMMLGIVFLIIVIFMPAGLVAGLKAASRRLRGERA
jgi:branched-chain amino acid transport system permease protein